MISGQEYLWNFKSLYTQVNMSRAVLRYRKDLFMRYQIYGHIDDLPLVVLQGTRHTRGESRLACVDLHLYAMCMVL